MDGFLAGAARVVLGLWLAAAVAGGQVVWDEPGVGDWNTGANWSGGLVPGAGQEVDIGAGAGNGGTAVLSAAAPGIGRFWLAQLVGESGTLRIEAGGALATSSSSISYVGIRGTGVLEMAGGTLGIAGPFNVAGAGTDPSAASGTVVQTGGAITVGGTTAIGQSPNATGLWQLGGGSADFSSTVYVGNYGTGTVEQTGGSWAVTAGAGYRVGELSGSDGSVVQSGGTAAANQLVLARNGGSKGSYAVSGTGALTTVGDLWAGYSGEGSLVVSGGTVGVGGTLYVGRDGGGSGSVQQTGGALAVTGDYRIAEAGSAVGAVVHSGGTASANRLVMARLANNQADYQLGGTASLTTNGDAWVAHTGTGTLTVADGAVLAVGGVLRMTNSGGTATLRQEGGEVRTNSIVRGTGGTVAYEISGGELRPLSGNLSVDGALPITLTGGAGAIRSTDAGGTARTVTLSGAIGESGGSHGLGVLGTGTVILGGGGSNSFTGDLAMGGGVLQLNKTGGATAMGGDLVVGGGTVSWLQDQQLVAGARVVQNDGTVNFGGRTETFTDYVRAGGVTNTGGGALVTMTGLLDIGGGGAFNINSTGGTVVANEVRYTGGALAIGQGAGLLEVGAGGMSLQGTSVRMDGNQSRLLLGGELRSLASGATARLLDNGNFGAGGLDLGGGVRVIDVANGAAAVDLEIEVPVLDGGYTKTGAGTLRLSGNESNTAAGLVTVGQGTLVLAKAGGQVAVAGDVLVAGGTLRWEGDQQLAAGSSVAVNGGTVAFDGQTESFTDLSLSGGIARTGGTGVVNLSGTLAVTGGVVEINSNAGTITAGSVELTGPGSIVIGGGGGTLNVGAGGLVLEGATIGLDNNNSRLVLGGDVASLASGSTAAIDERLNSSFGAGRGLDLNGAERRFDAADGAAAVDLDVGVVVFDSGTGGALRKGGAGVLVLSTDQGNSYGGGTTVAEGTLLVNNTAGSGTGTGAVVVLGGGRLGGNGLVGGGVQVATGGAISPGAGLAGVGQLDVGGDVVIEGMLEVNLLAGGVGDRLVLGGASGLELDGALLGGAASLSAQDIVSGAEYWIASLDGGALSGTFANSVAAPGLDAVLGTSGAYFSSFGGWAFAVFYGADLGSGQYSGGNDLLLVVIPEPGRAALLGLGLALSLVRRRRR